MRKTYIIILISVVFLSFVVCKESVKAQQPNIIFIMADDLGYGDVQSFTPTSKIPTPNLNKLASQGLSFTNAHSSASVCTPSRYSFLTGRYSWRSRLKKGVLWVWDRPLIDSGQFTVGEMLKTQGYHTACIGKWHLGVEWPTTDDVPAILKSHGKNVNYDAAIKNGPTTRGFDYYFGQEVPGFPPHAFIENNRVIVKPTDTLAKGISGVQGAMAPGWRYEDLMFAITDKSIQYIKDQTLNNPEKPFFLYFAMSAPHTPIAPHENFQSKTKVGRYGNYVYEMDFHIGRIMNVLDSLQIADSTLVVFSSDNGGVNEDGLKYSSTVGALTENYGHNSNGELRGIKSDALEGGHRVPFIVRWPGNIAQNKKTDALVSQVDMMATFANLTGANLPENVAEDSFDITPILRGQSENIRDNLIVQSGEGVLSIIQDKWKLILCAGSGGKLGQSAYVGSLPELSLIEGKPVWKNIQLYNLATDIHEEKNVASEHQSRVASMMKLLKQYIVMGRSNTGKSLSHGKTQLWREIQWITQIR